MTTLNFSKMHGLGNDFMVIDAVRQKFELTPELIRNWGDRHCGIGFDQLLVVEPARDDNTDFFYRIFNADGTEVGQCGNGARCLAQFVRQQGLTDKTDLRVATRTSHMQLQIQDDGLIKVDMGIPKFSPEEIPFAANEEQPHYTLTIAERAFKFALANVGNPHAVIDVTDCENAPVDRIGDAFNRHPHFSDGINVGFRHIIDPQHIHLRVFERGAGETLACGSGACAAAVTGIRDQLLKSPVTVTLNGGDLQIAWAGRNMPVQMTGPATHVFDGEISL